MKVPTNLILLATAAATATFPALGSADSVVSSEVMALLYQDSENAPPPPAPPTEAESPDRWYAAAALGATFLLDTQIKSNDGPKFKFNTGIGLNLGVGYILTKSWAIEVRSGILWNEIDQYQGSSQGVTVSGGDGRIYQVPLMFSGIYSIPLSEKFSVGLKAGVGVQWTNFNVDNIRAVSAAGTDFVSYDNTSASFRWEVGIQLAHQIAHNIRIGGGFIFSGTSSVDIGSPTINGNTISFVSDDLEPLYNFSLGFGVNIAF